MQLVFLRRTAAGRAILKVQDTKLGARTSTIHVALLQRTDKKQNQARKGSTAALSSTARTGGQDEGEGEESGDSDDLEVKIAGYITVSPASAEVGLNATTAWSLLPPPPPGSGLRGAVDFAALRTTGRDGMWVRTVAPFQDFRRAANHVELFGPKPSRSGVGVVDQWARFCPGSDTSARWTNEGVAYLVDMFPMALGWFDTMAQEEEGTLPAKNWYPTVTLNVDFKKRLPPEGVEWLYSRVQTKKVRGGRTDLDVVVMDPDGDVVALCTQVGLVVSSARNIGKRAFKMDRKEKL